MKISKISNSSSESRHTPLTARQREVFEIIQKQIQKSNIVPSLRELSQELGISSVNGVRCHLTALERKGYIQRNTRFSRSIVLLTHHSKLKQGIPICGTVSNCRLQENPEKATSILYNPLLNGLKDCFLIQFLDQSFCSEYTIQKEDFLLLYSSRTLQEEKCFCVVDASQEIYLVRSHRNEKTKEWEFYSCGSGHERIKIVNPTILGGIVSLLRFNI